ncbi:MAG: polymer-forming cytoskeletal protein [Spirochaetaceae bacterium]|nr:polymer-forming cytoskeletal protein [Spirochaetaceae bacterium]MBP3451135.1 polymer-forming cytoskeletal protein [Spirochaetaceae bacterium]MBQ3025048.1 polymer-forming cytoskeletal protein [Spirochaetaceae bacterium]
MASFTDDISFNTMLGPGAFVSGDLKLEGFTRVDGDIYGNIETTGKLIIGENARIRGSVTAKSVIVIGIVEGDILAPEGIHLFSSAVVLGDVISRKIKADEKVIIEGYCISIDNQQKFEEAKKQWLDMRAISNKNYFGKSR